MHRFLRWVERDLVCSASFVQLGLTLLSFCQDGDDAGILCELFEPIQIVRRQFPQNRPRGWPAVRVRRCEGGVDVMSVVTPLVRGLAQVLHGDQVVELRVQLEVQEGREEDKEGQVEVEEDKVELKEKRT